MNCLPHKLALCALLSLFVPQNSAQAINLYSEWAGGLSNILGASDFFAGEAPSTLKYGFHAYAAVGLTLKDETSFMNIHLVSMWRMSNGVYGTTDYYTMHSVYPLNVRFELKHKFFFGLGVTPLLWSATGEAPGFIPTRRVSGRWAAMGEFGYQYAIIPTVLVTLSAAVQSAFMLPGEMSPKISMEGAIGMRFYIGPEIKFNQGSKRYGDNTSGKYEGHRYPYGIPKK